MATKRAWCPRCCTHLGPPRATQLVGAVDAKVHATVTGHPTEVWDDDGRVLERLYGEPALPLWGPVAGTERDG